MRALAAILALAAAVAAAPIAPAAGQEAAPAAARDTALPRPRIGAPPDWVEATDTPTAPTAPTAPAEQAIELLLSDEQLRLIDGGEERYAHVVLRIGTAQGLPAAALGAVWDPALGEMTLHRYRLIRDGRPIDLLGDGARIVVLRREQGLEQAMLDGRLTATLQPDDVRVGDIVETSVTITRRDSALAGRVESATGWVPGVPMARTRLRLLWPASERVRHRAHPGVPAAVERRVGDQRELVIEARDWTPPRPPENAPGRHQLANIVEVSNAEDWSAIAQSGAALYAKARRIEPGSPLAAEAARILALSPDPMVRAQAALKLVQQDVRYLFEGMDGGGFRPASAEETWRRRFGDCKGKTALLLALLDAAGIEATPLLVTLVGGDALPALLPRMSAFNHVLVRARIAGRDYWLDGTRPDDPAIARLRPPQVGHALPLRPGAALEPVPVPPLERPQLRYVLDLDLRDGVDRPAKATAEARLEGDAGMMLRVALRQMPPAERDRALREYWRSIVSYVAPESVGAAMDEASGAMVLTMRGPATIDWSARRYELFGASPVFRFDIARDGAFGRDAPFAVNFPHWTEWRQTILLPDGGLGFTISSTDLDRTLGAWRFERRVRLDGGRVTAEAARRSLAPEMSAADARAAEPASRELDRTTAWLNLHTAPAPGAAAIIELKEGGALDSVAAYVERSDALLRGGELNAARRDLEAALRLDPANLDLQAGVGFLASFDDPARARELSDRVLASNPRHPFALMTRGRLAEAERRFADAERDYSVALEVRPDWPLPRLARASVRSELGRLDDALADIDALEQQGVRHKDVLGLRASVLARRDGPDAAIAVLSAHLEANPDDADALLMRAQARHGAARRPAQIADLDAALAIRPSAEAYLLRAQAWPDADRTRREADFAATLRLRPGFAGRVALARAAAESRAGDYARAERALAEGERLEPGNPQIDDIRRDILTRSGRLTPEVELKLLRDALARAPDDATAMNNLCWALAVANRELDEALRLCEAAVARQPRMAEYLDSRGFTKLRLGRTDDAIADYDAALRLAPAMAGALYGRGLARQAKGDPAGAAADFAAARQSSAGIDATFRAAGLSAPDAPAAPAAASAAPRNADAGEAGASPKP